MQSEFATSTQVAGFWSGAHGAVHSGPCTLHVENGVIVDITEPSETDECVTDLYAVPGFIDCHEHIGIDVGDEGAQARESFAAMFSRGVRNMETMLRGGVTTIRDCGERLDCEAAWVDAVDAGILTGPTIIRSRAPIARTGGHAWYISAQTDGVDALRARVREFKRDGASFIKVMVTGGVGTVGSDQSAAEFRQEEIVAVVDEAHRLGMKVAAHGHGGRGVTEAIEAGIDTLEHGCKLDDQQLELLASRGITLIVTSEVMHQYCSDPAVPAVTRAMMPAFWEAQRAVLAKLAGHGVDVALGSDCVHGGIVEEVRNLVSEGGWSVEDALKAATEAGARVVAREDIGRIEIGARADINLLPVNPFESDEPFPYPLAVVHDGIWAHRDLEAVAAHRISV